MYAGDAPTNGRYPARSEVEVAKEMPEEKIKGPSEGSSREEPAVIGKQKTSVWETSSNVVLAPITKLTFDPRFVKVESKIIEECEDLEERMRLTGLLDYHDKLFIRKTVEEVDLDYVLLCTENWANSRLIGEGRYGKVFRVTDALGSGSKPLEFAAKRLDCKNKEEREALNKMTDAEIKTLTFFNHPNIIKLLGFCKPGPGDMAILLYEYEPAGSVDKHLEDSELAKKLSWHSRAKIVNGLLAALHHLYTYDPSGACYHRDVKPGNIVLTASCDPKLIDCGLAQFANAGGHPHLAHLRLSSSVILPSGTPGFMCRTYLRTGVFNEKSEMFSVGVTFLQITTGLLDFADVRLDSLVDSPEVTAIAEERDRRPPFDDTGDDHLIVDGLAAMVEKSIARHSKRCTLETLQRMADTLPGQRQGEAKPPDMKMSGEVPP